MSPSGCPNPRYSRLLFVLPPPPRTQASLVPRTGRLCQEEFPPAGPRFCLRFPPVSGAGSGSLEGTQQRPGQRPQHIKGRLPSTPSALPVGFFEERERQVFFKPCADLKYLQKGHFLRKQAGGRLSFPLHMMLTQGS